MDKERKIYSSFHDIPAREYMYFPKGSLNVGKPGSFSRLEINHILISMFVLTFIFALILTGNNFFYALVQGGFNLMALPYGFGLAFIGITTAFFFHEISHKIMAQRMGLWAEYRMFPQGLKFALLLGLFTPLVFAAPGAVMFRGSSNSYETSKIAMAGPLANIIIAAVGIIIYFVFSSFFETGISGTILGFICYINAFLAIFNLLPFGPLDGTKIIRGNATAWVILFIASISLLMIVITEIPITF
jgi:Zn-dependent protease